ncbi:transcriptional regulator [Microtetraspora sp. NBRC 13810]|uniref:MarR family winged helix-turn-helix transcriptional regulator n=1 Tax=Microtetraspora sp. NBRC 13810 TaxID=3030990 RepID=UPI00249F9AF6|nr:MarR family transcriptional regulator [Microtetraspora sp. NBRC 13810]GLW10410.1 transcriptional regulator [Microtetraspora sp. NBRC 13810]
MRHEITEIERELMLIGRHATMAMLNAKPLEGRMERSSYVLLRRLHVEGPMSIGQLAEVFGLDTSTVNRQTATLLRSGLAERIPDPDGGMARKLRITDEGLSRLEQERAWTLKGLASVLGDWSPEELSAFADGLARFNASIAHRGGCHWPRPETAS